MSPKKIERIASIVASGLASTVFLTGMIPATKIKSTEALFKEECLEILTKELR